MLPAIRKNVSAVIIPQKHLESAIEANQFALNHYALAISGRLCGCDGDLNLYEKTTFLTLFPYFSQQHLGLLKESATDSDSVYINCKRFNKFSNDNLTITARFFARLFNLAIADDSLNVMEISFLEKVSSMLGLSKEFLEKALEYHFIDSIKFEKKFVNNDGVKNYYRRQITKLHPDLFSENNVLSNRIKNKIVWLATERMKILNENYSKSLS